MSHTAVLSAPPPKRAVGSDPSAWHFQEEVGFPLWWTCLPDGLPMSFCSAEVAALSSWDEQAAVNCVVKAHAPAFPTMKVAFAPRRCLVLFARLGQHGVFPEAGAQATINLTLVQESRHCGALFNFLEGQQTRDDFFERYGPWECWGGALATERERTFIPV